LRLSAEKVNLAGDTLRLTGRAMVRFDDTSVVADEIVINQASKQVELTAVRQIFIGARSRCAPPPSSRPRVEYR
jgi:lipopolysaccharide export system protein LptA